MRIGDFVNYNEHKAIITEYFLVESENDDMEFEELFTIKILESNYFNFGEQFDVFYCYLDEIFDEKEISRLKKLMVFQ